MIGHPWTWSEFYDYIRSQEMEDSVHTGQLSSGETSNDLFEKNWYYTSVLNPNLGISDVAHHKWTDVKGDIKRRTKIQTGVMTATIPVKTVGLFTVGPVPTAVGGFLMDQAITQAIWAPTQTLDMYSDLYRFYETRQIHDKRLHGHSIRSR